MRYHYAPIRIAKIQDTDNTKCWQRFGASGTLIHYWWECKMVQPLWKTVWQFLTKLNILLPYHPAIALLSIYPNESKNYVHTRTCTQVYSSFIHNCRNLKANMIFFNESMDKQNVTHPDNGILFSNKKKCAIKP